MTYYNPDGTINANASDQPGIYTKGGGLAISIPGAQDLSSYAKKTDIPTVPSPSTDMPPAADLNGSVGTSPKYALADHTHAVKIQKVRVTTDSKGQAVWIFAKPFINKPSMSYMVEDNTSPCIVQVIAISTTSATIQLFRSQFLPNALVSLSGLLSYNIFGATNSISGITISLFAGEVTQ